MTQTVTYDLFSPTARANPQIVYEQMRKADPVYRHVGLMWDSVFWVLTRYDDCVTVLKDPRIGKQMEKHLPPEAVTNKQDDGNVFTTLDHHLLSLDPPD